MKLYILNYYCGGCPMDGETIGVYTNLEEAKSELKRSLEDMVETNIHEVESEENYWYYDNGDFWGGCKIEVTELK